MVLELVRGTWKGYGQNAQQKHHAKRKAQKIFFDIYQLSILLHRCVIISSHHIIFALDLSFSSLVYYLRSSSPLHGFEQSTPLTFIRMRPSILYIEASGFHTVGLGDVSPKELWSTISLSWTRNKIPQRSTQVVGWSVTSDIFPLVV